MHNILNYSIGNLIVIVGFLTSPTGTLLWTLSAELSNFAAHVKGEDCPIDRTNFSALFRYLPLPLRRPLQTFAQLCVKGGTKQTKLVSRVPLLRAVRRKIQSPSHTKWHSCWTPSVSENSALIHNFLSSKREPVISISSLPLFYFFSLWPLDFIA